MEVTALGAAISRAAQLLADDPYGDGAGAMLRGLILAQAAPSARKALA